MKHISRLPTRVQITILFVLFVILCSSVFIINRSISSNKPITATKSQASTLTQAQIDEIEYQKRKDQHENHFGEEAWDTVRAAGSTLRINPLQPVTSGVRDVPIVAIAYFPRDSADPDSLDKVETGWSFPRTISTWENTTKEMVKNGLLVASNATRYQGYKNPNAIPYLRYKQIKYVSKYEKMPRGYPVGTDTKGTTLYHPDYAKILKEQNICDLVDNQGVREIWIYGYHHGEIVPDESRMGGNRDVSNSDIDDQHIPPQYRLPLCSYSYILYNFTYHPKGNVGNNIHNRLHQMENMIGFADSAYNYPFELKKSRESLFLGDISEAAPYLFNYFPLRSEYRSSCGNAHLPPNWRDSKKDLYNYKNTVLTTFNCETWNPVDSKTTYTAQNCSNWDCTDIGYYMWWMQNLPGYQNTFAEPRKIKNVWDLVVDFDLLYENGRTLYDVSPCISGHIFDDINGNGVFDPSTENYLSADVELIQVSSSNRLGEATSWSLDKKTVINGGWYQFCNLSLGRYKVQVTLPVGYTSSPSFFEPNSADTVTRNNGMSRIGSAITSANVILGARNFDHLSFGLNRVLPPTASPTPTPTPRAPIPTTAVVWSEIYTEDTNGTAWGSLKDRCVYNGVSYPYSSNMSLIVNGKGYPYSSCNTAVPYKPFAIVSAMPKGLATFNINAYPTGYTCKGWDFRLISKTSNQLLAQGTDCSSVQRSIDPVAGSSYKITFFLKPVTNTQ